MYIYLRTVKKFFGTYPSPFNSCPRLAISFLDMISGVTESLWTEISLYIGRFSSGHDPWSKIYLDNMLRVRNEQNTDDEAKDGLCAEKAFNRINIYV